MISFGEFKRMVTRKGRPFGAEAIPMLVAFSVTFPSQASFVQSLRRVVQQHPSARQHVQPLGQLEELFSFQGASQRDVNHAPASNEVARGVSICLARRERLHLIHGFCILCRHKIDAPLAELVEAN